VAAAPPGDRPDARSADLVVAGAAGRMGSRIVALVREAPGVRLVAALEAAGHRALGADVGETAGVARAGVPLTGDAAEAITAGRVLVEFSAPAATLEHLRIAAAAGARAVIGTTGFSAGQREEIAALGRRAPIMLAPNMSVAVTLAFKLLPLMARALGDDYDVEITEIHHRFKKDAPSGTAAHMAELIAEALGRDLGKVGVYGRQGLPGERPAKEIGVMSLRSGDVVGEHTVSFGSLGERLELTHRAHSRDTFARGALRAARWIVHQPPGLYSMADVLGLA
jgi:4-hydroxy-tetrahydrodipicolinate reductase